MLITPRPTTSVDNLIQSLESVHRDAFNLRAGGGGGDAFSRLMKYLEWAGTSARMLGGQISEKDLGALVLTRRYESLLTSFGWMASTSQPVQRVVNDVVSLELNERVDDLAAAIASLKAAKEHWASVDDLVVLDTNFYLVHPDELKDTDLAQLTARLTPGWAMHVLVPMLVVDELDRLKRDHQARSRARTSLKMLNEVFAHVSKDQPAGRLRAADDTIQPGGNLGLGPITMELLFDPPGHTRLPDNDDEIIDRALAVQNLAGRPVTMVTYDQGMSFRARYAGLKEMWLPHPPDPQPTPPARNAP